MKIHETIRQRRLAKNYTQEQVANYLGVTAPAVNKWEKGNFLPRHYLVACACTASGYGLKHTALVSG